MTISFKNPSKVTLTSMYDISSCIIHLLLLAKRTDQPNNTEPKNRYKIESVSKMATTTATKLLTANDDKTLRPLDLRNPMFRLLQEEKSGECAKPSKSHQSKFHQSSSVSSASANVLTRRHFLPESVCNRVENSWALVQNDLEELGLEFFLRVFESSPELLALLPYGQFGHSSIRTKGKATSVSITSRSFGSCNDSSW
mmetsp:Transcript_18197/g.37097  ORF Transcript_18197/g.37097 Transcript_18197/m.37097 type:complete len:198 (+) Transcript_18197:33-626(+)